MKNSQPENLPVSKTILKLLTSEVLSPVIIIDYNGNVLVANKAAADFLSQNIESENLFELVPESTGTEIAGMIDESLQLNQPVDKTIRVNTQTGQDAEVDINLYNMKAGGEGIFLILIKRPQIKPKLKEYFDVKIFSPDQISSSEPVLNTILQHITENFPFSLIEKENIRTLSDKLQFPFWIKDAERRYILVNKSFAILSGFSSVKTEGQKTSDLLPAAIADFYQSVENFSIASGNSVCLNRLPFQVSGMQDEYYSYEIPFYNPDNELKAIIGFSIPSAIKAQTDKRQILEKFSLNLISKYEDPAVIISSEGKLQFANERFLNLFGISKEEYKGKSFNRFFSGELAQFLEDFTVSTVTSRNVKLKNDPRPGYKSSGFYLAKFRRLEFEDLYLGTIVVLPFQDKQADFLNLLNIRGGMIDILLQKNPEPIFIYDEENLRFLEVNNSALKFYGYTRDEFLQLDLTDLYAPEDIQSLLESSADKPAEGIFSDPIKHIRKDGSDVYVIVSKNPVKYNERKANLSIIRDVSSQFDLRKKIQLYKSAFDNTEDLIFVANNSGVITFVNKAVNKLLGYQPGELENTSFASLVKDDERATVNTAIFQSHLKEPVSVEMELKKQNGEFLQVELTATPVLDFKEDVDSFSILGKVVQIPVEKEEPQEIVKEVIKEVVVEKAAPEKEKSEFDNPIFLSSLFHEILTPINVILGFVQELSDSLESKTPEQSEAVRIINENRKNLLNTMNSILEYSNLEQKKYELELEETSITVIIDQLQKEIAETGLDESNEFAYGKISSSLSFVTDRQKFQNLLIQLVNLIVRISRGRKTYFSAYAVNDQEFAVTIKDNYSAASEHLINALRRIFVHNEPEVSKEFGLSKLSVQLTRTILNILQGRFEILEGESSKKDYGFIFKINPQLKEAETEETMVESAVEPTEEILSETALHEQTKPEIPSGEEYEEEVSTEDQLNEQESVSEVKDSEEQKEPEIPDLPEVTAGEEIESEITPQAIEPSGEVSELNLADLTCLYIEDQVDSQILFKVQMKGLKDIKFAVSFEEALPLLDNYQFDFIVMDINLQGEYNGLDALKIIHKMPGHEHIPIIAVTAYVLPGDKEKFIAAGFNDFISKPIFRDKMIESLEKIFLNQN